MKENRICCTLNFAPHYRKEIFMMLEDVFDCDFYFGNKTYSEIKKIDVTDFRKEFKELDFVSVFKKFYFLKGQLALTFKDYSHYIITGQPFNISSWFLLIFNRIQGKKTFIWNHGWYGNENWIKKTLKKLQFQLATGYLLYGEYAKNLMKNEGFNENKLHVIYNSLDYSRQLGIRKELRSTNIYKNHFNNNNINLLFVGRLTKIKKLELLIEALALGKNNGKYYNLILIGSGTEKDDLLRTAIESGIREQIWFFGACYLEKKLGELIYNADICISPGNIGLTAIHSMMFGTPAITHNNFKRQMPEFEAIVEGETGSFFKEGDKVSLQNAIQQWVEHYPVKSEEIVKNCYSKIDRLYNPSYQIDVLKKILT